MEARLRDVRRGSVPQMGGGLNVGEPSRVPRGGSRRASARALLRRFGAGRFVKRLVLVLAVSQGEPLPRLLCSHMVDADASPLGSKDPIAVAYSDVRARSRLAKETTPPSAELAIGECRH